MLLTPTYHVFEMYVPHHGATLLPTDLKCAAYGFGGESMPGLSASASRDATGRIHITLCNMHPSRAAELAVDVRGAHPGRVSGRILTASSITAHNTFEQPGQVMPTEFDGARISPDGCVVRLPGKSVVVLALE